MGRPVILLAVFLLVVVKIPFLARNKMEVSCTFGVVVLTYTVFNNVYFLLHSVFISLFASASLSLVMFFNLFMAVRVSAVFSLHSSFHFFPLLSYP